MCVWMLWTRGLLHRGRFKKHRRYRSWKVTEYVFSSTLLTYYSIPLPHHIDLSHFWLHSIYMTDAVTVLHQKNTMGSLGTSLHVKPVVANLFGWRPLHRKRPVSLGPLVTFRDAQDVPKCGVPSQRIRWFRLPFEAQGSKNLSDKDEKIFQNVNVKCAFSLHTKQYMKWFKLAPPQPAETIKCQLSISMSIYQ